MYVDNVLIDYTKRGILIGTIFFIVQVYGGYGSIDKGGQMNTALSSFRILVFLTGGIACKMKKAHPWFTNPIRNCSRIDLDTRCSDRGPCSCFCTANHDTFWPVNLQGFLYWILLILIELGWVGAAMDAVSMIFHAQADVTHDVLLIVIHRLNSQMRLETMFTLFIHFYSCTHFWLLMWFNLHSCKSLFTFYPYRLAVVASRSLKKTRTSSAPSRIRTSLRYD